MDPVDRERISKEIQALSGKDDYWRKVIISSVTTEKNVWMEGRTIADISSSMGLSEIEALFRVLIEERLRVGAIFLSMSEMNLKKFLALPYCMIGSDSSSRSFDGPTRQGRPHPRTFGAFPAFWADMCVVTASWGSLRRFTA